MLEQLPLLKFNKQTLIAQQDSAFGRLYIYQQQQLRWLSIDNKTIQSLLNVDAPAIVQLPYLHDMLLALALTPNVQNILNLGAGCGTIERYFSTYLPQLSLHSVEVNKEIIELSKSYFFVPEQCQITQQAAEDYLTETDKRFDIIFCDLHAGDKHPQSMLSTNFLEQLKAACSNQGIVAINFLATNQQEVLAFLLKARKVFKYQKIINYENYYNVVIFLSGQFINNEISNDQILTTLNSSSTIDYKTIAHRLLELPQ